MDETTASVPLRIVLEKPPAGVDYALQQGKGRDYELLQTRRSDGGDLTFTCTVTVKNNRQDGLPNFLGPLTQGPPAGRFLYVGIGQCAGNSDSCWSRRIKVPLAGITREQIRRVTADAKLVLEFRAPGTDKRGGPACATLKGGGWALVRK